MVATLSVQETYNKNKQMYEGNMNINKRLFLIHSKQCDC